MQVGGRGRGVAHVYPKGEVDRRLRAQLGHARVECTLNISRISVTREVFQLEISALKFCKDEKRFLMLVTSETSQFAIGPYASTAAVELTLYSRTAVFRAGLFVKT